MLQLRQRHVGLRLDPSIQLRHVFRGHFARPTGAAKHTFHLTGPFASRRDLPAPRNTHAKTHRQLFQRPFPSVVGL